MLDRKRLEIVLLKKKTLIINNLLMIIEAKLFIVHFFKQYFTKIKSYVKQKFKGMELLIFDK